MAAKSRRNPIAELYGLIAAQTAKLANPSPPPPIPASHNHVISPAVVPLKTIVPVTPPSNHVITTKGSEGVIKKGLPYHTWFPIDPKRHNRTLTMFHAHDPTKTITLQCVEPPGHSGGCHYENPGNKKRTR